MGNHQPTPTRIAPGPLTGDPSPAFALLAVRGIEASWWWLGFAALAGIGLLAGAAFVVGTHSANPEPFEFGDIEDAGPEVVGHIGSYLIPALVDVSASTTQAVVAAVGMLLIFQIHVTTGRVLVNPVMYLFGFRTYTASVNGNSYYLLATTDPATWVGVRSCRSIGNSILVESPQ